MVEVESYTAGSDCLQRGAVHAEPERKSVVAEPLLFGTCTLRNHFTQTPRWLLCWKHMLMHLVSISTQFIRGNCGKTRLRSLTQMFNLADRASLLSLADIS